MPSHRGRIAFEQRMFGFGIERRRRLVENEQERLITHEAARQRQLLPLAKGHVDAARPGRPELRVESRLQAGDHIAGPGAIDRRCHGRHVVETREIADADRLPRQKFEAKEILERSGRARPPLSGVDAVLNRARRVAP